MESRTLAASTDHGYTAGLNAHVPSQNQPAPCTNKQGGGWQGYTARSRYFYHHNKGPSWDIGRRPGKQIDLNKKREKKNL